jgi:hypothetical protein
MQQREEKGSKPEEEEEENWRTSSRQAGRQAPDFKATMVPTQSPFFTLLQQMFHATANLFVWIFPSSCIPHLQLATANPFHRIFPSSCIPHLQLATANLFVWIFPSSCIPHLQLTCVIASQSLTPVPRWYFVSQL